MATTTSKPRRNGRQNAESQRCHRSCCARSCAYLLSSPANLRTWCLTCHSFYAVCDKESLYRAACIKDFPVLFSLGLTPFFSSLPTRSASSSPLGSSSSCSCPFTWQERYQFAKQRHPWRLRRKEGYTDTPSKSRKPRGFGIF